MTRRERFGVGPEDQGVSPVVGMILVLAISIVGIAAILYWGLPAIDEMKANVEHRSVESQFLELDSSIKELVAGTTEKTAKRWQPTLNRGQVGISNETEGWVYAVETYQPLVNRSFLWADFEDGDSEFTLYYENSTPADDLTGITIQAYRVNGTTSGQELVVDTNTDAIIETMPSGGFDWTGESAKTFRLWSGSAAGSPDVPIRNATIRFRIYDDAVKIAEAWYVPTGRVDYRLDAGMGTKTVTENNGAVISGNGVTSAIVNQPPIPPVANNSGVSRFFARALVINGTGSFAGDDRFDVLVTLYSTATLGSYDCSKADRSDCVETVKLFVFGTQADTWYGYLTNPARGYTFGSAARTVDAGGITYKLAEDREGWMGFTLLQSTVVLSAG